MPIFTIPTKALVRTLCFSKPVVLSNLLAPFKSSSERRLLCTVIMNSGTTKEHSINSQVEGLLIKDIVTKLESWAPLHLAGSWDKVGLQVEPSGDGNRVSCLMLTNDLTEAVVKEAVAKGGIGLIISYHPPIFQALRTLTNRTWKERVITSCIENRIAVYTPHTAWDAVDGGVNDWLASAFDSTSVKPLTVSKTCSRENHQLEIIVPKENNTTEKLISFAQDVGATFKHTVNADDGRKIISIGGDEKSLNYIVEFIKTSTAEFAEISIKISKCEQIPWPGHGEGRFCLLKKPVPLKQIVEAVKRHLKLNNVRLAIACNATIDSPVQSVALCAGSGSSVLSGVKADVMLTGEMGHHEVLEANHRGLHVILCEHSNTERGFICSLVDKGFLHKLLGGRVDVVMSSKDQEPLQIV